MSDSIHAASDPSSAGGHPQAPMSPRMESKPVHITPRLRRVLLALNRHLEDHAGVGPTAAELAVALDQSRGATVKSLALLLAQGFTRRSRAHRDIELTAKGQAAIHE